MSAFDPPPPCGRPLRMVPRRVHVIQAGANYGAAAAEEDISNSPVGNVMIT